MSNLVLIKCDMPYQADVYHICWSAIMPGKGADGSASMQEVDCLSQTESGYHSWREEFWLHILCLDDVITLHRFNGACLARERECYSLLRMRSVLLKTETAPLVKHRDEMEQVQFWCLLNENVSNNQRQRECCIHWPMKIPSSSCIDLLLPTEECLVIQLQTDSSYWTLGEWRRRRNLTAMELFQRTLHSAQLTQQIGWRISGHISSVCFQVIYLIN